MGGRPPLTPTSLLLLLGWGGGLGAPRGECVCTAHRC